MKSILTIVYFIIAVIVLGMLISQSSKQDKGEFVWPEVSDPTYTDIIFGKPSKPTPFSGMYD